MSEYTTKKYIDKKFNDILMDTPVVKSYNLGMAVGLLEAYRCCKSSLGKETSDKIYADCIKRDDEFSTVLRTLIELDDKETCSTAERIAKILESKKPKKQLSNDDRDFLEDFMEFLYKKKQKEK